MGATKSITGSEPAKTVDDPMARNLRRPVGVKSPANETAIGQTESVSNLAVGGNFTGRDFGNKTVDFGEKRQA